MNQILKKILQAIKNKRVFETKPDGIDSGFVLRSEIEDFKKTIESDDSSETKEMANILLRAESGNFENDYSRKLIVNPKSIDKEKRTAEFTLATDTPVKVIDWELWEFVDQILSFKKSHVNLERFKIGAPFLNAHKNRDIKDQIGVIESAEIVDNSLVIKVRFSKREDVEEIWQDVVDGIFRNVSVGFDVHEKKEITKKDDKRKTFKVTSWEPMEGSLVPIGADLRAQIRSKNTNNVDLSIENKNNENNSNSEIIKKTENRSNKMFEYDKDGNLCEKLEDGSLKIVQRAEDLKKRFEKPITEEDKKTILDTEKARQHEIKRCCKIANVSDEETVKFTDSDMTVEEARKAIFASLEKRSEENKINASKGTISVGTENKDKRRALMTDAILVRSGALNRAPKMVIDKEVNLYRNLSLLRMASEVLRNEGVNTHLMGDIEIAKRAFHTSSDFSIILQDAINKSLRTAYDAERTTFDAFTDRRTAKDFKTLHSMQFGGAISLEEVQESGEYKSATLEESEETYKVKKHGKNIKITEETIINDDSMAFSRLPMLFGQSGKRLESDLVWAQITGNPTMEDSVTLFHATHGNIGTAGVPSVTTLGELRKLLRLMTGLSVERLNLTLSYLAVPAALETEVEKLVSSIVPTEESKVNPFWKGASALKGIMVEPRLDAASATAYYGFAGKEQMPVVELAALEGMQNGPQVTSYTEPGIDGFTSQIKYTINAKAVEWRGATKNLGA